MSWFSSAIPTDNSNPVDLTGRLTVGSQDAAGVNLTALNAALAVAGSYSIGPGTFYVDGALQLGTGVTLKGVPGQTIIALSDAAGDYVVRNAGGFDGNTDIWVEGIIFDQRAFAIGSPYKIRATPPTQNSDFGTGKWTGCMLFIRCNRVMVRDCESRDYSGNGLIVAGGQNIQIRNHRINANNAGSIANDGIHIMGDGAIGASAPNVPLRNVLVDGVWFNEATDRGCTDVGVQLLGVEYNSWRMTEGDLENVTIRNVFQPRAKKATVRLVGQKVGTSGTNRPLRNIVVENIFSAEATANTPALEIIDDSGDGAASGVKSTGGTVVDGGYFANIHHRGTGYVVFTSACSEELTLGGLTRCVFKGIHQIGARTASPKIGLAGVITDATFEDVVEDQTGTTYAMSNVLNAAKTIIKRLTFKNCGSRVGCTLMGAPFSAPSGSGEYQRITFDGCFQGGAQWMVDGGNKTSGTPAKLFFLNSRILSGASGFFQSRGGLWDVQLTGCYAEQGASKILRNASAGATNEVRLTTAANRRESTLNNNTPANAAPLDTGGTGTITVDTGA